MSLDPAAFYHHGIVVADLESAVAAASREHGLTFTDPWVGTQRIRTPEGVQEVEFRFVYSAEGPVHLELIQQMPGTLWVTDGVADIHHLGYWSDDVAADGARLEAGGMELAFEHVPDEGRMSGYRYYRSALGFYVELVHSSMREPMENLWAATLLRAGAPGLPVSP
ncbi:VOC family protein [Arthrobacter sp. zg-ZUI100]|uniref:VOC family protein n=1 Tax=Arthrobacter jiangjiafuii TaxID=2817475 RepID=UPI001AEEEA6E|nr:VOC family protein [Arthrobacter jiangjiafuii]